MTSLACGSLRARGLRPRACGARPGLLWPRRSVWSFEGGAQRSERGATCGRPVLCVRVKLDDFAQRRCAPLRCAPEAFPASGLRRATWIALGQGAAFGASRAERSGRNAGRTCGRPVLCVRVKLDDFAQRRCAPLRCAPEAFGLGLAARDLDCFGQGAAFGASRAERRGRGAGRPAVAPCCAFASSWMTSLSVAARRFAARPSPKGSGLPG